MFASDSLSFISDVDLRMNISLHFSSFNGHKTIKKSDKNIAWWLLLSILIVKNIYIFQVNLPRSHKVKGISKRNLK